MAFHNCVRNASRSWRAENFCKISYVGWGAVVRRCRGEKTTITPEAGAHIDGDKVLERLAHLEPLDVQMSRVDEVVHPRGAVVIGL